MLISLQKSNQLKAIAILMMLFLHLFNSLDYQNLFQPLVFIGGKPLVYYLSLFGDACVPIFAFVSGYGLYYKYSKSTVTYPKDNVVRLKKLYLNYWIIILLFPVAIGLILQFPGYPGSMTKFLLNATGLDGSYNGAWWFFTTYVLFVCTSAFWFRYVQQFNNVWALLTLLAMYLIAFYLRIYKGGLVQQPVFEWIYCQGYLFFCTLPQFLVGAYALKLNWNEKVARIFERFRHPNLIGITLIMLLICIHAVIPNFVIAPFLGLAFIFIYAQLRWTAWVNKSLDFLVPHATNMWLVHMFFYMIFFKEFIYSFKYVPLIFVVLVALSVFSSVIINFLLKQVQKIL